MSHYAPWQQQPAPQGQPAPAPTKKRRTWLWAGLAVAAVLGICGIGSCVVFADAVNDAVDSTESHVSSAPELLETPAPTGQPADDDEAANDAPASVTVGQTLTVTGDGLEVKYTVTKVEQKSKDRWGMTPDHGVWLLAHVKAQVVKGETFVCSCDLAYISKSGKVFEEDYADFKSRPMFESANVKAGQNVDGWVVFDAPKPIAGGKIQLTSQNLFTDNAYGYWQL